MIVFLVLSVALAGFAAGLVVGVAYGVARESDRRDELLRAEERRRRTDSWYSTDWGRR